MSAWLLPLIIIAIKSIVLMVVLLLFVAGFTACLITEPDTFILIACGLGAALSWGMGRALFFILAGR